MKLFYNTLELGVATQPLNFAFNLFFQCVHNCERVFKRFGLIFQVGYDMCLECWTRRSLLQDIYNARLRLRSTLLSSTH